CCKGDDRFDPSGWTDDRSRSERDGWVTARMLSERGTGGVSGEWSGSQARISR
ncbi:unnamed protein product, partial [Staurois parvus]